MKINVTNKKINPVLKREELTVSVNYEGGPTPSIVAFKAELAKAIGATEDRIEVARLISSTGHTAGNAWVRVWETADLVPKPKVKKVAAEKK